MDLQLLFNGAFIDLQQSGSQLALESGLQTAVLISLFSDRLAEPGDRLAEGDTDRRGWWGDRVAPLAGDRLGSRLWLLAREKSLPGVARRAEQYASEALQWLIEDGIARSVEVNAEIGQPHILALAVRITRPDGSVLDYRFANLWEVLHAV